MKKNQYKIENYKTINFAAKRNLLHKQQIEEIKLLMKNNPGAEEMDFTVDEDSDCWQGDIYIIRSAYGGCSAPEEVKVLRLKLDGEKLMYMSKGEDYEDDTWQDLVDDVVGSNLDDVYEAVIEKIKENNEN